MASSPTLVSTPSSISGDPHAEAGAALCSLLDLSEAGSRGYIFHAGAVRAASTKNAKRVWPGWRCKQCGTDYTSIRRRGPGREKDELCNTCGLRHAKREKDYAATRARMSIAAILN